MGLSIGIIGYGSFGKFLAGKLQGDFKVRVYARNGDAGNLGAELEDVARSAYIILAVPLGAYEKVLQDIKPLIGEKSVLIDVCSVKQKPAEIIRKFLPGQPMVATHPLFGPESAQATLKGHTIVLCPDVSDQVQIKKIEQLAMMLGLKVRKMTATEHDKEMATIQGLTFFIARALKGMDLHELELSTPSFNKLLSLAELEEHHSDELFYTIQAGNENTQEIRQKFIALCRDLESSISKDDAVNNPKI